MNRDIDCALMWLNNWAAAAGPPGFTVQLLQAEHLLLLGPLLLHQGLRPDICYFRYLKSYSRAFTVMSKSRQNFRTSHFNMFEFGDLNKKVLAQIGRHSRRGWIKGNHQMLWRTKVQFEIENWKTEILNFFNKQQSYPIAQILNKQNSNCCSRISEIVY